MPNTLKKYTETAEVVKAKEAEVVETAVVETSTQQPQKIKARAASSEDMQQQAQQAVENVPQNANNAEVVVAEEVEQVQKEKSNSNKMWWLGEALSLAVPVGIVALSNKSSKDHSQKIQDQLKAINNLTNNNVSESANNASSSSSSATSSEKTNNTVTATSPSTNTPTTNSVAKTEEKTTASQATPSETTAPQAPQPPKKSYRYDATAFKNTADGDNDGLLDILDPNPTMWNVSERDLRAFSLLAYEDKKELEAIFKNKDFTEWQKINEDKKKGFNNAYSEKEGKDFYENWDLLEFKNTNDFIGSGLDYSVYGHGKKEDGSYQQIIFAFRGSKGQYTVQDYWGDLKVLRGELPTQAKELVEQAKVIIDKYNPDSVYATGHSLGGYLSQYFTAYIMQESPEYAEKMKHSAIFNPLHLLVSEKSPESLVLARNNNEKFTKQEIENADANNPNPLYKTNSYVINGEFLADGGVPESAVNKGKNIAMGVGAAVAAGIAAFFTAGLSLVAAGAGAVAANVKANSLAKEVLEKIGYGTYDNAVRFEPKVRDWLDSHAMIRFYEKTDKLNEHFSFGIRNDNWAIKSLDTDRDGIYDVVENYFGSDPNDASSIITHAKLAINGKVSEEATTFYCY